MFLLSTDTTNRSWACVTREKGGKGSPKNPESLAEHLAMEACPHSSYLHTFAKHRLRQGLGQEKR